MLRVVDERGGIGIGITRVMLNELLAGKRQCVPGNAQAPHVCLFFEEDDDALLERLKELYPDGLVPGVKVEDYR